MVTDDKCAKKWSRSYSLINILMAENRDLNFKHHTGNTAASSITFPASTQRLKEPQHNLTSAKNIDQKQPKHTSRKAIQNTRNNQRKKQS